jgi:uroporphyrin-III C-methyltransferase
VRRNKVYLIGAGPGDWELISVKGLKQIRRADVILYDFLAAAELLRFAKKSAEIICVGKQDGMHLLAQRRINQLLYEKAAAGKSVVRLKGGDPFVFSRGIEEALFLRKKGIDLEIIPGITSAFAAPESFGIPLSRRGKFTSLAVLTGRKSNKEKIDAPKADTLIYLMAVANIKQVVEALVASGRSIHTRCAFIEKATTKEERIISGRLANIVQKAERYQLRPPAVFVVGEVIKYARLIHAEKFKNR